MTATYWQVGQAIVEREQLGARRAEYGEAVLKRLAGTLTARYGRGFSKRNLEQMRAFYLAWPKTQTTSALSQAPSLPLPWSHHVRGRRRPGDAISAEEELKDPLVLEFLGLKDEYSESDLEEALVHHLEHFPLELGGDFRLRGTSAAPPRWRCVVPGRPALLPPDPPLPHRHRSEARSVHPRRRRADAPVPELRP